MNPVSATPHFFPQRKADVRFPDPRELNDDYLTVRCIIQRLGTMNALVPFQNGSPLPPPPKAEGEGN